MADMKMPDLNRVELAGRLTRDPELRYIANGTAVCKLGMAVSRKFKTKAGDLKEDTLFINVTVWGASGEWVGEKMQKGEAILVEGRLSTNTWTDKATGSERSSIECTANRVQALTWPAESSHSPGGGRQGAYKQPSKSEAPEPRAIEEPIPDDDMPF